MRLKVLFVTAFLCAMNIAAEGPCDTYAALTARSEAGEAVNYQELRFSRGDCENSSELDSDLRKRLIQAVNSKQHEKAIEYGKQALAQDYANSEIHMGLAIAYEGAGNVEKFEHHKKVHIALVRSILESGDGKSPATAFVVDETGEEYVVLRALGLQFKQQALISDKKTGKRYDVMTVAGSDGREQKIYFNIERPMKRLEKALGEAK
jgi:hypothetical protein